MPGGVPGRPQRVRIASCSRSVVVARGRGVRRVGVAGHHAAGECRRRRRRHVVEQQLAVGLGRRPVRGVLVVGRQPRARRRERQAPTSSSATCRPGTTRLVSVASDGTQANGTSFTPSISADGNVIAFRSDATNLVPNDTEGHIDVFVHTMSTGRTVRVSQKPSGVGANSDSIEPSISADGKVVAFSSLAHNLVPQHVDATGLCCDIFVSHLATGHITLGDPMLTGGGASDSFLPVLSATGRYLAFGSWGCGIAKRHRVPGREQRLRARPEDRHDVARQPRVLRQGRVRLRGQPRDQRRRHEGRLHLRRREPRAPRHERRLRRVPARHDDGRHPARQRDVEGRADQRRARPRHDVGRRPLRRVPVRRVEHRPQRRERRARTSSCTTTGPGRRSARASRAPA